VAALTHALEADRREYHDRAGRLSIYRAGQGAPLLLAHSINAAGSAYEVRPLFEHYRARRRVFAPDLPGFGFSDRSRRRYDVRLYVDALHDAVDRALEDTGASALDALALSLSSEFLARAALERPERFRSLALVTPTGFTASSDRLRDAPGTTREMPRLAAVLEFPVWRRGLYRLLVTPASVRYFLRRTWGSADIDHDLAAYDDLTTHQPGAEHAPLAFLSGRLFSRDIRSVYEQLPMPVWLAHGTLGDFSDFRGSAWTRNRANWTVQAFDTGALPHFEQPAAFCDAYDRFLAGVS
jgi:pimeloyl-ACP methyl ester carboxylesterase